MQAAQAAENAKKGLGPDGQPLQQPGEGGPGEDGGDEQQPAPVGKQDQEEEPDYEGMSTEQLQEEMKKLQQPEAAGKPQPKPKPVKKAMFFKELEL